MSDPYDADWSGMASAVTAGPPSSFLDNIVTSFERAQHYDTTLAIEHDVQEEWNRNVDKYNVLIKGKPQTSWWGDPAPGYEQPGAIEGFIRPLLDPESKRNFANLLNSVDISGPDNLIDPNTGEHLEPRAVALAQARKLNEEIKSLGRSDIKSIEQVLQDVVQKHLAFYERADQVAAGSSTFDSLIGGSIGGIAGFLASIPDNPENALGLVGGGGRTLAMRLAGEAAVGAGAGFLQQQFAINPNREALGLEADSAVNTALTSAGAALVFGAGVAGIGRLASRYLRALPQDLEPLDFNDAQMRQMFEARPEDPTARAGLAALNEQRTFDIYNPYGDSTMGTRRFTGEITDVLALVEGRTSTAIARALPPVEEFTFANEDYHVAIVREQQPLVYGRLEQASHAVNDINEQIAAVSARIDNFTISEVVDLVDTENAAKLAAHDAEIADLQQKAEVPGLTARQQAFADRKLAEAQAARQKTLLDDKTQVPAETRARIKEIEDLLNGPIMQEGKPKRALVQELDKLLKQAGELRLETQADKLVAGLRDELSALNKAKVPLAAEFRRARSVMDREIARVKVAEKVRALTLESRPKPLARKMTLADQFVRHSGDEVAAAADEAIALQDAEIEGMSASMLAEDGPIRVGDVDIDPAFTIQNPEKPGELVKLGTYLKRALVEEDQLLEATKVCSI